MNSVGLVGDKEATFFNWSTIRGILFSDFAMDERIDTIDLLIEGGVPAGVAITTVDGRKLTIREAWGRIHVEWEFGFDSEVLMDVLKALDVLEVI